jgi:hypothetical protein
LRTGEDGVRRMKRKKKGKIGNYRKYLSPPNLRLRKSDMDLARHACFVETTVELCSPVGFDQPLCS